VPHLSFHAMLQKAEAAQLPIHVILDLNWQLIFRPLWIGNI
jgi:hypothetical protein